MQAIRAKNLAKLNMMIQWHKRPDDSVMPSKMADKPTWYYNIYGGGDPVAPQISGSPNQKVHQEISASLLLLKKMKMHQAAAEKKVIE